MTVTIPFLTPRGTERKVHLEVERELGLNIAATGPIEPSVARKVAHALLYHADVVEQEREAHLRTDRSST